MVEANVFFQHLLLDQPGPSSKRSRSVSITYGDGEGGDYIHVEVEDDDDDDDDDVGVGHNCQEVISGFSVVQPFPTYSKSAADDFENISTITRKISKNEEILVE